MSWAGWSGSAAPSSVCRSLAALFLIALSFILMGTIGCSAVRGLRSRTCRRWRTGSRRESLLGWSVACGVAGWELIIPAIVLAFAVDGKLAGSLSLAVEPPCPGG